MAKFGRNVGWIAEAPVPAKVTSKNVSMRDAWTDVSVQMVRIGLLSHALQLVFSLKNKKSWKITSPIQQS